MTSKNIIPAPIMHAVKMKFHNLSQSYTSYWFIGFSEAGNPAMDCEIQNGNLECDPRL